MSGMAGLTTQGGWFTADTNTPAGSWALFFADVTIVSADGTVTPVFTRNYAPALTPWNQGGVSGQTSTVESPPRDPNTSFYATTYYVSNHLGTVSLELTSGNPDQGRAGWPIWQGRFTPFGQEIIGGTTANYIGGQPLDGTSNRYKFTAKERDAESGLDNFGPRYYASTMGRFMSPDPVFATVDRLADPQQWNMYSYVRNNPLSLTDPTGLDFNLTCDKNNGSTCVGGLQGQTVDGKFQATDVDMNNSKDAGAGYHDQFGTQYTGSFNQDSGVSFTNTAPGEATSSNSRFIDGSDETDVNGSGSMFGGTQGRFNSNCGGSCEAKGSIFDLPGHAGSVANAEQMIGKSFEDNLNFFGGHGKSTSYRTGEDQLTHLVVHAGGATEIHFEGHPPGRDLMNFVLHQVDAIRDSANHQSSKEPNLP